MVRKAGCKKLAGTDTELTQKGADSAAQEVAMKGTHLPFGGAYREEKLRQLLTERLLYSS